MNSTLHQKQESASLEAILVNGKLSIPHFFESVWQDACALFPGQTTKEANQSSSNAYHDIVQNGWNVLIDLLDRARKMSEEVNDANSSSADNVNKLPLLFKHQTLIPPDERKSMYGSSLFAAFLDGCSVVINHADTVSPAVAALCHDLQRSFPHAYANTYLTPAESQAVGAHADDRDVLVIQVYGSKAWKVYERIPIPYPYPAEQVGKEGLQVPQEVLEGPLLIEQTLRPGDVLYMPRGFVHEARAIPNEPSFHITVALATHDWSLAGLLLAAGQHVWPSSIINRKAIAREFGTRDWNLIDISAKQALQEQIDGAIEALRREVTVEMIHKSLSAKYLRHNERAKSVRETLIANPNSVGKTSTLAVVGRPAAENVFLETKLRVATDEEKASIPPMAQPRGLNVLEVNYHAIIHILQALKGDPLLVYPVKDLSSLIPQRFASNRICKLTLLCFARQCVEMGALAICPEQQIKLKETKHS